MTVRPDVTCHEVVEFVTDYLENTLSRDDRHAFEHHLELPHFGVATGQLRRPLTGAGRIGIPDRIHAFHSMRLSSVFLRFR